MQMRESTLALNATADITRSAKQRYQWPHKKDSCPTKIFKERKKKKEAQGLYAELLGYGFFLNFRDIVYNIFENVQLLWLLHSIGPSP